MRHWPALGLSSAIVALGGMVLFATGCAGAEDAPLPDWEFCPDLRNVEYDLLYVPGVKYQVYSIHIEVRLDGAEARTYWLRASSPMDGCYRSTDADSSANHRQIIDFARAVRASEKAELSALRCCNVADFLETACVPGQFRLEAGRELRLGAMCDMLFPETNIPFDLAALASAP